MVAHRFHKWTGQGFGNCPGHAPASKTCEPADDTWVPCGTRGVLTHREGSYLSAEQLQVCLYMNTGCRANPFCKKRMAEKWEGYSFSLISGLHLSRHTCTESDAGLKDGTGRVPCVYMSVCVLVHMHGRLCAPCEHICEHVRVCT